MPGTAAEAGRALRRLPSWAGRRGVAGAGTGLGCDGGHGATTCSNRAASARQRLYRRGGIPARSRASSAGRRSDQVVAPVTSSRSRAAGADQATDSSPGRYTLAPAAGRVVEGETARVGRGAPEPRRSACRLPHDRADRTGRPGPVAAGPGDSPVVLGVPAAPAPAMRTSPARTRPRSTSAPAARRYGGTRHPLRRPATRDG